MTRRHLPVIKVLFPFGVSFFVGLVIHQKWQQVQEAKWELHPIYLVASFVLTASWFIVRPLVWSALLKRFGYPISFRNAYFVVRRAELSRYVPGTIWQYVTRVSLANRYGVPAVTCMAATLLEIVLVIFSSLGLAIWNLSTLFADLAKIQRILLVIVPAFIAILMYPRVLNFWLPRFSRVLKQPYREINISWSTLLLIWMIYLGVWFLHSFGVGVFVRAVVVVPSTQIPVMASYYALAWLVATVSVVSPAGVGIRDGVLGLLLNRLMPTGVAFAVSVAVRLWITVLELLWVSLTQSPFVAGSPSTKEGVDGSLLR